MNMNDPIVDEVRRIRRGLLASHGGDFERYCRDVMRRQSSSARGTAGESTKTAQVSKIAESKTNYQV
jgi:hypothetical protein